MRGYLGTAALALGVFLAASRVEAMPAFSRKYAVSCGTCHAVAYPELNPFGRRFKEAGYQLPGGEPDERERTTLVPNSGERLEILREAPLSLRLQGGVLVPGAPQPGQRAIDTRWLENLYLFGGGSLYPDVSAFFSLSLAPSAYLHHASVGFHNLLLGEGHLNLRLGRFLLLDFLRPEHRDVTRLGNPTASLRVGLNPTALDSTQQGVEVYGRLAGGRLFYALAVVDGSLDRDGLRDLDDNKDLFAQLEVTPADGQRFAALGYLGRTQILDEANGVKVLFTDRFWNAGAAAELTIRRATLFAQVIYARHDNPTGAGVPVRYLASRGQLDLALASRWLGLLRYDRVDLGGVELDREVLTLHLTYLALTNCRLSFESQATLNAIDRSVFGFRLDVAL